ncbi:ADP-sugar pyrophosphatase-like [Lineus longissimus]|uniref:ADP-sugar pyrophosphatase-like n=1 Tax=Lineus longissimus TaxID=88925 RepID=UPI00315DD521
MADERDDTKSPPMKKEKAAFKSTDAKTLDQQQIATGKWISLNLITYQDPLGNKRTWEGVERTTKSKDGGSDAVIIIPTLKRMYKFDCIILVKQFRPPLGCCTLEFPAGLVDPGESMESTAVRELKEETGYVGKVKYTSPVTTLDAGTGNCTASMVTVEIDGDLKANKKPVQEAEENEFIEVLKVPIGELLNYLNVQSKEGFIVDARVYSYAIALAQASEPPLQEKPDLSSFDG